jgi:hypothetical protein
MEFPAAVNVQCAVKTTKKLNTSALLAAGNWELTECVASQRREIITVRGQSYFSRLPQY